MTEEFPGNSQSAKQTPRRTEITSDSQEERSTPRVEPVLEGAVIRRKKGFGRRLKEALLGDGSESVGVYLLTEVIIPAVQNAIIDVTTEGVHRIFDREGEARSTRRTPRGSRPSSNRTHVSYDTYASRDRTAPRGSRPARRSSFLEGEELIVRERWQAEDLIAKLEAIIEKYGLVSVATLNDFIGETGSPVDGKWGWFDLDDARVRREGRGYRIVLPPVEDIREP